MKKTNLAILVAALFAPVIANAGSDCGPQICALSVVENSQGALNNGGVIPASWNRANPDYALGAPNGTAPGTFYALGFTDSAGGPAGSVVLDMGQLIGGEITVYEATNYLSTGGDYPAEYARVYGSQDPAGPWTYIGAVNNASGKISDPIENTNTTTLGLCGAFYQYIKLEDASDSVGWSPYTRLDGFDLDAVCVGSCPTY